MAYFAIIISVLEGKWKESRRWQVGSVSPPTKKKKKKISQLGTEGNPDLVLFPGSASSGKWLQRRNPKWELPKLTD